jgi:hypothetical protein
VRSANVDLPNRALAAIVALCLLAGVFLAVIVLALPDNWGRPGGPLLQGAAFVGSGLLIASFVAVLAKRFGRPGKEGFRSHVWLASLGAALVFAHAASNLDRPPAALLLILAALIGLGIWSRTNGARLMASTFGQKRSAFGSPQVDVRNQLAQIIQAKQALLATIDPTANEALFSASPRHWRSAPFATLCYVKLAAEEEQLTQARGPLSPAQAWWRLAHRLLAWAFVAGLIGHVLIVMLFAGYVADGQEIYWLHFAGWDF